MALGNHLVEHLLQTADFLIESAPRNNLGKAYRRRAISTAYYATFHAVGYILTSSLIGWSRPQHLLEPVFRSLDHKIAKDRLLSSGNTATREIGLIFARLQKKRNDADYRPPAYSPGLEEAREALVEARDAVARLEALDDDARRRFAVSVVGRTR